MIRGLKDQHKRSADRDEYIVSTLDPMIRGLKAWDGHAPRVSDLSFNLRPYD